jgi:hypothetical protein
VDEAADRDDAHQRPVNPHESLHREALPIVQAAAAFVRDAQRTQSGGTRGLSFAERLALGVHGVIREALSEIESEPVVYAAAVTMTAVGTMTIDAEVRGGVTVGHATAVGTATGYRSDIAGFTPGQFLFLLMVWVIVLGLPPTMVFSLKQGSDSQQLAEVYCGEIAALVVAVTVEIVAKREKRQ